jgi:hypothetical protein
MQARCTRPLTAWYSKHINPKTGKREIVFNHKQAIQPDDHFNIPCGRCIGCRFEKARQWAMRCVHESKMHENNCFLTLTFDDEHLAKRENPYTVDKRDFQLFMKRLRKIADQKIGYYHCGEYGEKTLRPHYHACLFNYDFADKQFAKRSGGNNLYVSEILNGTAIMQKYFPHLKNSSNSTEKRRNIKGLWPFGVCLIGEVTFQSASYTARYIMKKMNGQGKDRINTSTGLKHYERSNEQGEIIEVNPEYTTMSTKPPIGRSFLEKYKSDMYPKDYMTVNGIKMKPPKYYDRWMEEKEPLEFEYVKEKRKDVKHENMSVLREQQLDEIHQKMTKRFERTMQTKG